MKKLLWFSFMAIIFFNALIGIFFNDYPLLNNIALNFSILAIAFMVYVIFFEKKVSAIARGISVLFGVAGLANVVFKMISLQSDVVSIVLACILLSAIITVAASSLMHTISRE